MTFFENHIIADTDFIQCGICGKNLEKIDNRHLKIHKISFTEYKKIYSNQPTLTKKKLEKELIAVKKRNDSKSQINNNRKDVPCFYHNNIQVNVNINHPKFGLCEICKLEKRNLPAQKKAIDSMKKTIKEKYNVNNISELQSVIDKRKSKWLNKTEEEKQKIIEKRENQLITTFGTNWKEILNILSKEGMIKKYGFKHALQIEKFVKKFKEKWSNKTNEEKNQLVQKIKETKFKKYNNENYINRDKINQTNQIKYGGNSPTCEPKIIKIREEKRNSKMFEKVKNYIEMKGLKFLDNNYEHCYYYHNFKCLKCNFEFKQTWNSIQQGFTCQNCRPQSIGPNKPEKELQEYIKSFNFQNISFNNHILIFPWELDIVIHDLKIAIEYNGFYYHNDEIVKNTRKNLEDSKKYHSMKRKLCLEKGYRLITIFEDEWVFHKDIVLGRLNQILGKKGFRIHGRDCIIKEIPTKVKNQFLEEYHIQGKDSSTIKLGAFYNSKLVSIMTFSKGNISKGSFIQDGVWELNRFCINYNFHIPGIASKLLEHFKRNYSWIEIYSYADLRWSHGNLYRQLGFISNEKIIPNYWYIDINKVKRIHRFSLRKRANEPKDISEHILRLSEGYKIIWDCGNLKFVLKNENLNCY